MRIALWTWIEHEGARFKLRVGTRAVDDLLARAFGLQNAGETADMIALLPALFRAAIADWEGLEDEEGQPLAFAEGVIDRIPTPVKLAVINQYISELAEIDEKKGFAPAPPTS